MVASSVAVAFVDSIRPSWAIRTLSGKHGFRQSSDAMTNFTCGKARESSRVTLKTYLLKL